MIHQVKTLIQGFKFFYPVKHERVLEVGSGMVGEGGDEIRLLFKDAKEYIGVDMVAGTNVDQVVNGHDLVKTFGENSFDLVMCLETLEHDDKFWLTVEQMRNVLKPEGWMIITVPGIHCHEHRHPKDYWRFMEDGVREMFDGFEKTFVIEMCWDTDKHGVGHDAVMGWGRKPITEILSD